MTFDELVMFFREQAGRYCEVSLTVRDPVDEAADRGTEFEGMTLGCYLASMRGVITDVRLSGVDDHACLVQLEVTPGVPDVQPAFRFSRHVFTSADAEADVSEFPEKRGGAMWNVEIVQGAVTTFVTLLVP